MVLLPIAVETFGSMGQNGLKFIKSIGRKIKEKQAIKMQLFSHHNPRTVQRGNAASVVGPVRGHSSITSSRFWLF